MQKLSYQQSAAQAAGYPASLFGLTPDDKNYWVEPGLPWASGLTLQRPPLPLLVVWLSTDAMAPRFPREAGVVLRAITSAEPLTPGVYCWQPPGQAAEGGVLMGRLRYPAGQEASALLLSLDNGPVGFVCPLQWDAPGFALYRVTHYASLPAERRCF